MFNTKICKNCFESYSGKPETCPHCGILLNAEKPKNNKEDKKVKIKKERKRRITSKEIMDSINFVELNAKANQQKLTKKQKEKLPEFKVEKSGEYSVDIKDVTYLPSTYTYSAKKARGEYDAPKIKWWEIYKWADLMLAKRKIKKQVKRASHYRPQQISKSKLLTLCIFFGWMGGHNFYARNYRKGIFVLVAGLLGAFVALAPFTFLNYIRTSIGGGLLFVVLFMWGMDLINIICNTYSYRLSKWKFIDCLNTDTRATLGAKYIDKDEYKKPWCVRTINAIKESINQRKAKKQRLAEQKAQAQQEQTNNEPIVQADADNAAVADVATSQPENQHTTVKQNNKPKQNKKAKVIIKKNKK